MKLVTEKNLNKYAYPVFPIKGRSIELPYRVHPDADVFNCIEGYMKPRNWLVMDILATYVIQYIFYHKAKNVPIDFKNKIPTSRDKIAHRYSCAGMDTFTIRELIELSNNSTTGYLQEGGAFQSVQNRYEASRIRPIPNIVFSDRELKKQISFLRKYSSQQLCDMFKNAATCKVGMRYPVLVSERGKYMKYEYNNYNCPCSFFTITKITNSNISKDGHVLERLYNITFDTYLGYFFIQNVLSCYVDLLPYSFYKMSDYAQLYYRFMVLTYFNHIKDRIRIDEIQRRLLLKTSDTHMLRTLIKDILKKLEAHSFIKDAREEFQHDTYWYVHQKTPWKDLIKE